MECQGESQKSAEIVLAGFVELNLTVKNCTEGALPAGLAAPWASISHATNTTALL